MRGDATAHRRIGCLHCDDCRANRVVFPSAFTTSEITNCDSNAEIRQNLCDVNSDEAYDVNSVLNNDLHCSTTFAQIGGYGLCLNDIAIPFIWRFDTLVKWIKRQVDAA